MMYLVYSAGIERLEVIDSMFLVHAGNNKLSTAPYSQPATSFEEWRTILAFVG